MTDSSNDRPSLVEYVGFTMIVTMLLLGIVAAALPETVLAAILRPVLRYFGVI